MNPARISMIISLLLLLFPVNAFSQQIDVNNMIGKTQSAVIKKYGNPVHQDNSIPSMKCMFYEGEEGRKIFVANEEGIFQAECFASFKNEKSARKILDDFISSSIASGYQVDTVTISDFHLQKTGVKIDLQVFENKLSKKFEISVKANKAVK